MLTDALVGDCLVPGTGIGDVLFSDVPLSFMGGVDPFTGLVIDVHHPLHGECVTGRVLAIPSGRGSCSGSGVVVEMLVHGSAPAALVFGHLESILTLGVVIARELFGPSVPVVRLSAEDFETLRGAGPVAVTDGTVHAAGSAPPSARDHIAPQPIPLTATDERILAGELGEGSRTALRIVLEAARLEGATELVDVELGHIDGCFYQGPASLALAQRLAATGSTVQVPTTMNAVLVDRRRWRDLGVDPEVGEPSDLMADALVALGVQPTYTCAPYLLATRPQFGQQLAWAESNAVVFANSVLGARTMKYPDYLDLLVALTGRAPAASTHLPAARRATVRVDVHVPVDVVDDAFWPVLGYHVGTLAPHEIPVLTGLADAAPTEDDLKAFGAAFATTSAAPMFHLEGVTPEAATVADATGGADVPSVVVDRDGLVRTWAGLDTATADRVDLVSLGNPHFSLTECATLADLCDGRRIADGVRLVVTCGREVHAQAEAAGHVARVEAFGGAFLNDTCWCFLGAPVVPDAGAGDAAILTNSGKYAHYGAAAVGRGLYLRNLDDCVRTATTGRITPPSSAWRDVPTAGAAAPPSEPEPEPFGDGPPPSGRI